MGALAVRDDSTVVRVPDEVSDVDRVVAVSENDSGHDASGGDLVDDVATVLVCQEDDVVCGDAFDHSPTPVMWVNVSHAPG